MFKKICLNLVIASLVGACSSKQYKPEGYDKDPSQPNHLSAGWNETDMQLATEEIAKAFVKSNLYAGHSSKQIMLLWGDNYNRTLDSLNLEALKNSIEAKLLEREVGFVGSGERNTIQMEHDYMDTNMDTATRPQRGKQVAANYIIKFDVDSVEQEMSDKNTVYYQLMVRVTDLSGATAKWGKTITFRKLYSK